MGVFLCHKIQKGINLRRESRSADFKIKSHQPITEKRIDSEMKSISAITLDPLDRKTSEDCKRKIELTRYRMVPLSGTFTVESGGVSSPQLFQSHVFKALKFDRRF